MKKAALIIITIVSLYSCDTKFKAEKVAIENYNNGFIYETHLVKNLTYSSELRDSILINYAEKEIKKNYELNSNLSKFGIEFYRDVSCTRRYYKNLKRVESIDERCEEDYCGSFQYKKSEEKPNQWYLIYPKNMKDTIYCNEK